MNTHIRCCLTLIFLAFFFLPIVSIAATEQVFPFGSYRISIPAQMEQVPPNHPGSLLLLQTGTGVFPTFNIIEIGGAFDFNRPKETLLNSILASYQSVGLQSSRVVTGSLTDNSSFVTLEAVLEYENNTTIFRSHVFVVSDPDRHFIATYLYPKAMAAELAGSFDKLLASVEYSAVPSVTNADMTNPSSPFSFNAMVLIAIILIGLIAAGYRIQRIR